MSLTGAPDQQSDKDLSKPWQGIIYTPQGVVAVPVGEESKTVLDNFNTYELKHDYGILKTHSGDYLDMQTAKVLTTEEAWAKITQKAQIKQENPTITSTENKKDKPNENISYEEFYNNPEIKNVLSLIEADKNNRKSHEISMLNKFNDALKTLSEFQTLQKDEKTSKSFDSIKEIVQSDWRKISDNIIDDKIKTRAVSYLKETKGNIQQEEVKRLFGVELQELENIGVSKTSLSTSFARYDRELFSPQNN